MRERRWWIGAACGMAVGLGALVAAQAATDGAAGQASAVRVTPGQLLINQRISQAGVRRSNEALRLLSPLRGTSPPGWSESALAAAVRSKLHVVHTAAVTNAPGQEPALARGRGAVSVTRATGLPAGAFDVTFASDISACTWTASVSSPQPGAVTPVFAPFVAWPTGLDADTLRVFTFNAGGAGALADAPFTVHVVC